MNKYMKKLAAGLLAFALMVMLLPAGVVVSFAASGKLSFSDPTVSVGDQISVTMKIAADAALGSSDVMLQYDADALEFVSGTNSNGGAGSVRVIGSAEAADQKTFSFTLKFNALKAGTSSITVKSQEVYDADSKAVTLNHIGSSSVKINAADTSSRDASLASLTISPGTLKPAFSADTTEYTAAVPSDVTSITVSAPAKDGGAKVTVSGNDDLQDGENTITCTVTAEDGETTKTYTIVVTKSDDAAASAGETDSDSAETNAGVVGEDGNWTVADTFDDSELPSGFTATEIEYEGRTVKAATDDSGMTLLYMTDDSGNGDFFVYNSETGALSAYVVVKMAEKTAEKTVVVLPPECIPEGTALPDGFAECTIDIGDHTVHGWIWKDSGDSAPEYCIVYGRNENGEEGFYRYDQKEMTLQRYFQDPDAADARSKYLKVAEDYNSLLKDYEIRGMFVIGLFALSILLVIIIIVLLLRKPKAPKNPDRDGYDDDYGDYEGGRKNRKSEPKKAQKTGKSAKAPERRTASRPAARREELFDEEEEEIQIPRRRPEAAETCRPAAKRREAVRTENVPERTDTPERPVRKNVADMEKDLSKNLAKEAAKAAPKAAPAEKRNEDDDDFEFIDLDL